MKQNVGKIDRLIRLILGLGIIGWGMYAQTWWRAVGIVLPFTAAIGWCPAYLPFGLNSYKTAEQ